MWNSCRLSLSLMCLAATLGFFLMRLNLSFAIVCMIKNDNYGNQTTHADDLDHSEEIDLLVFMIIKDCLILKKKSNFFIANRMD